LTARCNAHTETPPSSHPISSCPTRPPRQPVVICQTKDTPAPSEHTRCIQILCPPHSHAIPQSLAPTRCHPRPRSFFSASVHNARDLAHYATPPLRIRVTAACALDPRVRRVSPDRSSRQAPSAPIPSPRRAMAGLRRQASRARGASTSPPGGATIWYPCFMRTQASHLALVQLHLPRWQTGGSRSCTRTPTSTALCKRPLPHSFTRTPMTAATRTPASASANHHKGDSARHTGRHARCPERKEGRDRIGSRRSSADRYRQHIYVW
jgi:hypothetical protein